LMSIFPRDEKPVSPRRQLIDAINHRIADYAQANHMIHLDIGPKFLSANGSIPKALMPDFCHPTEAGYRFWADALMPLLK
ncbi:MAG TPA: acetylhydrolase, partial [Luteolibacter sp.]